MRNLRPFLLAGLILILLFDVVDLLASFGNLRDWGSFIASGSAANRGLNPYGIYPLTNYAFVDGVRQDGPNLNAPLLLPLFQFIAHFPPFASYYFSLLVSLAMYLAALVYLSRSFGVPLTPLRFLLLLTQVGLWETFLCGQIYVLLLWCVVAAWVLLHRGQDRKAGIAIGLLVALKPNFALWILLLVLARHFRLASTAAIAALCFTLLPLPWYGPQIYVQWFAALSHPPLGVPLNLSLANVGMLVGFPAAGQILTALVALVAGLWTWRTHPDRLSTGSAALALTLLVSPLSWLGYALLLVPAAFTTHRRLPGSFSLFAVPLAWGLWPVYPLAALAHLLKLDIRPQPVAQRIGIDRPTGSKAIADIGNGNSKG